MAVASRTEAVAFAVREWASGTGIPARAPVDNAIRRAQARLAAGATPEESVEESRQFLRSWLRHPSNTSCQGWVRAS